MNTRMFQMAKEFEEEKTSIEEDLYQAVRNRPQNSLRINIVVIYHYSYYCSPIIPNVPCQWPMNAVFR